MGGLGPEERRAKSARIARSVLGLPEVRAADVVMVFLALPDEVGMYFSPSARFPDRSSYGAAGIDGAIGVAGLEISGEAGATFEGAPAGVVRGVINPNDTTEIEIGLRYYDRDYDKCCLGTDCLLRAMSPPLAAAHPELPIAHLPPNTTGYSPEVYRDQ